MLINLFFLSGIMIFSIPLMASQEAQVVVDEAIIYADQFRTSPIGYLKRGKIIKIGDTSFKLGQVYPTVVNNRITYISSADITIISGKDAPLYKAGRFGIERTHKPKTSYHLGYSYYPAIISMDKSNYSLKDKDNLNFTGIELRGETNIGDNWRIGIILNYHEAKKDLEIFRFGEIGANFIYPLYQHKKLRLGILGGLYLVPFISYELVTQYRAKGYGFATEGLVQAYYDFSNSWGVDLRSGFHLLSAFGLKAPAPYNDLNPSFVGVRTSLSLSKSF